MKQSTDDEETIIIQDGVEKVREVKPSASDVIERFHHSGDISQLFADELGRPEIHLAAPWSRLTKDAKVNRIIKYSTNFKLQSCLINALINGRLQVDYDPIYCVITRVNGLRGPDKDGRYCIEHKVIRRVVKHAKLTFT